MSLDTKKIISLPLPESEYHKIEYSKNQVVLHHTASGNSVQSDIDFWKSKESPGAIATAFLIGRDGLIYQCFSSKYYAAHLGVPTQTFTKYSIKNTVDSLHKHSVGIELDNWGYLIKKGNKYYSSYGNVEIPAEKVVYYSEGFKGYNYYEKYTKEQIQSLKDLVVYLCDTYKIDKSYNSDMWGLSKDALEGKSGIYTHVSYRESGKWDCHPQPELIEMLKSLK